MKKNMRAALLTGLRKIEIKKINLPCPQKGEVLIKVKACAVCGSDIRIFNHGNTRVKFPAVIGHEISGKVVSVGEGSSFKPGDRIAVGADVPNMKEDWGKSGLANMCDLNYAIGYQFPGGFAEYCLLNELVVSFGPITKIPDHVTYQEACLCEPLACCINGLERSHLSLGKSMLVIGAGPIGILLCRAAVAFGAGIVVLVDIDKKRIKKARQMGIVNVENSLKKSLRDIACCFKCSQGFDIVITACPSPEAQEEAVGVVAKRGMVNFFGGLPDDARKISFSSNILHYKEAAVTGSHGSTPSQHALAMKMIACGRIEVKSLISHSFSLNEIEKAFFTVEQKDGLKVIVTP